MKLRPKNLEKTRDTFQYQIYRNGSEYLLEDLPDFSFEDESMATKQTPQANGDQMPQLNNEEITHSSKEEVVNSVDVDDVQGEEPYNAKNNKISFKEIIEDNDNSCLSNQIDQDDLLPEFSKTDVVKNIVAISDSNWKVIESFSDIEILFLGDPSLESLSSFERDLENDYFQLLLRICSATKIPLNKFGFISQIRSGSSSFKESSELANVLFEVKPRFIISLGASAYKFLTNSKERLSTVHGKVKELEFKVGKEKASMSILPTFHPEYILINPKIKKTVWEDFQHLISSFL